MFARPSAIALLLTAAATPSLAQSVERAGTADARGWDRQDDWRRRAEAEREAMRAVADLFAPAQTDLEAGGPPARVDEPAAPPPSTPETVRTPPPGDPALFFE